MLVLLACCDKSTIVALEAIKALAGAPYPTAASISAPAAGAANSSGSRRPLLAEEHIEADAGVRFAMAWQQLLMHADDDAPDPAGGEAAAAAAAQSAASNKQFTISR